MNNKLEQKLDAELDQRLGVNLMIYHFREDVGQYTSITIVTNSVISWNLMRELLDQYIFGFSTNPSASAALKLYANLGYMALPYVTDVIPSTGSVAGSSQKGDR